MATEKIHELDLLPQSSLFSREDAEFLSQKQEELQKVFEKSQIFRTKTEMEISVLGDNQHPTADSKYWQCLREEKMMTGQIIQSFYAYQIQQVEIKKLERALSLETDELEVQLIEIKLRQMRANDVLLRQEVSDRIRELRNWEEIKQALIPEMEFGTENHELHQLITLTRRSINMRMNIAKLNDPLEIQKIIDLSEKCCKMCISRGVLEDAIKPYPEGVKSDVRRAFGVPSNILRLK